MSTLSCSDLVNQFRTISEQNAISPESLGYILQSIIDDVVNQLNSLYKNITQVSGDLDSLTEAEKNDVDDIQKWINQLEGAKALHHLELIQDAVALRFYPKGVELFSGQQCSMSGEVVMPTVSDSQAGVLSGEMYKALADKQTKLSVTSDFELTTTGMLSLANAAKLAVFIDLWNRACYSGTTSYGIYNSSTGYFELYDLKDITYEQAVRIMNAGKAPVVAPASFYDHKYCRANLPYFYSEQNPEQIDTSYMFYYASSLEVVWNSQVISDYYTFCGANRIRKLLNPIRIVKAYDLSNNGFTNLEDATFYVTDKWAYSLFRIKYAANLSLATLQSFSAEESTGRTGGLTVQVHADVYAKLTGDTSNASAAALSESKKSAWRDAYDKAYAKNIIFTPAT
jgi:hypothetical protein